MAEIAGSESPHPTDILRVKVFLLHFSIVQLPAVFILGAESTGPRWIFNKMARDGAESL